MENKIKKILPLACYFELTYKCNLSCVHCYNSSENKFLEEIDKSEIFTILEQLKEAGCLYLTLSGGEPLVRKDFFDIANYAHKLNFALRLFTNGTLIDAEVASQISNLKPIKVEVSLHGFKKEHEKITKVKGSYENTIDAIKLLKEKNIKTYVKFTPTIYNADIIWDFKDFVENKLKVDWKNIGRSEFLISPSDNGDKKTLKYRLTDSQLEKYILGKLKNLGFSKKSKIRNIKEEDSLCKAGFKFCNITPAGRLNPCFQIRLKENSLKNKSFQTIWNEHNGFMKFRNLQMKDRKECQGCDLVSHCFVCPGIAMLECGSYVAKVPAYCRQTKIRKYIYEKIF